VIVSQDPTLFDIVLAIGGGLFALVQIMGAFILKGIAKTSADTLTKLSQHGEALAALRGIVQEVSRLRDQVDTLGKEVAKISGAHDLAKAFVDALNAPAPTARRGRTNG
jgi:hypothetical protein